jgi:hypothetical protein
MTLGDLGLARSRCFNLSQRCSMRLRSGLCAGQLSSSTPISTNHFCMDLALCTGHCHVETGKGLPQTVATKLEVQNRLSLYSVALRFPFTGTKGHSLNHEKQPHTIIPPPNFTVDNMHWGR